MLRRRVLIVEDDDELQKVFRHALLFEGFEVQVASNGLEALRKFERRRPDVVILDLGLPDMSGHDVLSDIGARSHAARIPVVIVTGSQETLDHLDVDCVLRKPVTFDDLVRAVRRRISASSRQGGTLT